LLFLPVMNGEFQETMAGMTKVQHYPWTWPSGMTFQDQEFVARTTTTTWTLGSEIQQLLDRSRSVSMKQINIVHLWSCSVTKIAIQQEVELCLITCLSNFIEQSQFYKGPWKKCPLTSTWEDKLKGSGNDCLICRTNLKVWPLSESSIELLKFQKIIKFSV
jgi:hypothetical protein